MTPFVNDVDFQLYVGDALDVLRELPSESVHCALTSPPYWGLRDYGTGSWEGGDPACDHAKANARKPHERKASTLDGGTDTIRVQEEANVYRDVCGKCGALRVDRQIGLEPTPDEFVQSMVAVFREVRRVLRADGTLWLNLGDSYAGSWGAQSRGATSQLADRSVSAQQIIAAPKRVNTGSWVSDHPTLKPKDLVGIPWRVAFALQQPYYTGRIKDERDRIWLAAMIDAEGCIFIHKRKVGQSNGQGYERKSDTYGSGLEVSNTSREVVERVLALVGKGSISTSTRGRNQPLYRWNLRSNECRDVLREVYPHLVAKQQQARLAIGCPSSGADAEKAHASLIALHNGDAPTIDFAAPETMFEPGWYLRSDVIWSKSNPMPESVTDRPTKAHEYVFMLSKSPRYFFDQEAVREKAEWARWGDQTNEKHAGSESAASWIGAQSKEQIQVKARGGGFSRKYAEQQPAHGAMRLERPPDSGTRNVRSVWEIATQPYPEAHFATFPEALPERCIKAGTSERGCCPECGSPWVREMSERGKGPEFAPLAIHDSGALPDGPGIHRNMGGRYQKWLDENPVQTVGWHPTCTCGDEGGVIGQVGTVAHDPVPCTVLDPFMGSGTTALVARRLGRRSIGIELNPEYAELAARRLQQLSLLAEGAA